MNIRLHPHAISRLPERGATQQEVIATVEHGEQFPVKHGRTGFRRNFVFGGTWRGREYSNKQIEAYAVYENGWLVVSFIVKYY